MTKKNLPEDTPSLAQRLYMIENAILKLLILNRGDLPGTARKFAQHMEKVNAAIRAMGGNGTTLIKEQLDAIDWKEGERYRFVNGVKVYRSYEDYIDD